MKKCAIIVNKDLSSGLKANISAILCMSLGKRHPEIIGDDLLDNDNTIYKGITTIPIPILETHIDDIKIARKLADENVDFIVVFNCSALNTKNYLDYEKSIKHKKFSEIIFHGILIYGDKKNINKIVGKFSLMK